MAAEWFVYLLECCDGSLYTGIAKDVVARIAAHGDGKGAKYTRGRGPFELIGALGPMTKSDALKREIAVKRMEPAEKRAAFEGHFVDGLSN